MALVWALSFLKGMLKVVYNSVNEGFMKNQNQRPILGLHRIYFGFRQRPKGQKNYLKAHTIFAGSGGLASTHNWAYNLADNFNWVELYKAT